MTAERVFTLSVVVPTHGGRASVADTVRAILAEPGGGLEVIVVSDGDPSRAREALAGIEDPRLRLVSQEQQGPAAARNLGLRESRHDWVAFVDDDDLPRPNWFGVWAEHAHEPLAVLTACVTQWQEGVVLRERRECTLSCEDPSIGASRLWAGAFVATRAVLEAVGGYDSALRVSENQDLGLRLLEHFEAIGPGESEHVIRNLGDVVMDVLTEGSAERVVRYGPSRAEAAKLMLQRYPDRLTARPEDAAALHRIISRTAVGQSLGPEARSAALMAVRISPGVWENWRSLILSVTPWAGRWLEWRGRRANRPVVSMPSA